MNGTGEPEWVWLHGRIVPAAEATVSIFDRSFLYGDGLFETLRSYQGRIFQSDAHLDRLEAGAAFLGIQLPFPREVLTGAMAELLRRNHLDDALVRLHLTRGVGRRGYSPAGATEPRVILSVHALPAAAGEPRPAWTLATSPLRLPSGDPLLRFKTANKLAQILSRASAEAAGADEALLLNHAGAVVETSSGNLFWIAGKTVHTPPVEDGALPGVTRSTVLALCRELGLEARETRTFPAQLFSADGIFVTLSSLEIVRATRLDSRDLAQSPTTDRIHDAYRRAVQASMSAGPPAANP